MMFFDKFFLILMDDWNNYCMKNLQLGINVLYNLGIINKGDDYEKMDFSKTE